MTEYLARFGVGRRLFVAVLLIAAVALVLAGFAASRPDDTGPKPDLAMMTTLPLQWSEGGIEADLAEDAEPHPAFVRLSRQYEIQPIDDLMAWKPKPKQLLLLAQPRAFSPQELVRLDAWVQQGGRVLILADPALQWGSLYALGDRRRPLFTSMLSPLFTYWGIELVLPMTDEKPVAVRSIGSFQIRTPTPGEWLPKDSSGKAPCVITAQNLLADCRIGKGRALLVADADLLDTAHWEGQGVRMITGGDEFANLDWISALLAKLSIHAARDRDIVGK
jgi:hypothetical protein